MSNLYLVPTPIGNMDDITLRAINTIKHSDLIICEDTRITGKLLKILNIENKKMLSYNDHNKIKKTPYIIEKIKNGYNISLLTDSGSPCISDPGFYIVRECIKENIKIIPLPGTNAIIPSIIASGLAVNAFTFYGFLPKRKGQKQKVIEKALNREETSVFFESPFRIDKTLDIIHSFDSSRNIVIAREITKIHEEFIRGNVEEVIKGNWKRKGEITLLIEGKNVK